MIQSGALFLNEQKVSDLQYVVQEGDFINGVVLLRKGKKVFKLIMKI
ncbi:MAG: hypothetical protein GXP45_07965 [bacterium]|nr:hypothetical protein [bacterium]